MGSARLHIADCPPQAVRRLREELGVSAALAQALVRRGAGDPKQAAALLAARESHPPAAMQGIETVLQRISAHVAAGSRITVHGDYDVDGVCATAILVDALRGIGGSPDWHIPARADGYGLRMETVDALAARGTGLLITVDCGITSVREVAHARSRGIEVIVTDHHAPRADGRLPDAPLLHPRLCGYPFPELCAAAVAQKLSLALQERHGGDPGAAAEQQDRDLDLVALATIADVVPLTGENRTLARRGLAALARTTRPGLRALMEVAGIDAARVDERAVGFGLAPRLNAAGRLYTADAALELLMTADPQRAAELAGELDRCNRERRETEQQIMLAAQAQMSELGPLDGYVLAGEGWHPGVVGIVASRLAERCRRPVVLVCLDGQRGRGSGRSIPAFDLLGGLNACADHLLQYGGHSAAAGLELQRERLPEFRAAFAAHAAQELRDRNLTPQERVDAVVSGSELVLELAEELRTLAPFGHGNPAACLLVEGARLCDVRSMGSGKQHIRFRVECDGGSHAQAVAFGVGGRLPVPEGVPVDATFTLEVNEWRGVCEPRLLLRHAVQREQSQPCAQEADRPSHELLPVP